MAFSFSVVRIIFLAAEVIHAMMEGDLMAK